MNCTLNLGILEIRLLVQIIKFRAQFPDHPTKSIRLDNDAEFIFTTSNDYCMSNLSRTPGS